MTNGTVYKPPDTYQHQKQIITHQKWALQNKFKNKEWFFSIKPSVKIAGKLAYVKSELKFSDWSEDLNFKRLPLKHLMNYQ